MGLVVPSTAWAIFPPIDSTTPTTTETVVTITSTPTTTTTDQTVTTADVVTTDPVEQTPEPATIISMILGIAVLSLYAVYQRRGVPLANGN